MKIEFFWHDLTETMQKETITLLGDNHNWDVIPFCVIEIEDVPAISQNQYADDFCHCKDTM